VVVVSCGHGWLDDSHESDVGPDVASSDASSAPIPAKDGIRKYVFMHTDGEVRAMLASPLSTTANVLLASTVIGCSRAWVLA